MPTALPALTAGAPASAPAIGATAFPAAAMFLPGFAMERLLDRGLDIDAMAAVVNPRGQNMQTTALCMAVVYRQARLASDGHTFVASHYRITSGAGGRPAVERVGNDMEVPGAACRASHGDLALTATDGDGGADAVVRVTSRGAVVAEAVALEIF